MFIRSLAIMAVFFTAIGCAEYRVTIPDSDPTAPEYEEATMHAYLWGNVMDPLVLAADCQDGINDMKIVDHLGYDFVSLFTLGIWKPILVRFRCRAPNGSGPVPFPSSDTDTN